MKLRKSLATPASSFFPCCFLCLLRSCQLSLHVSTSHTVTSVNKEIAVSWEGVVMYLFRIRSHLTCVSTSKTGVGINLALAKLLCRGKQRQACPAAPLSPQFCQCFSTWTAHCYSLGLKFPLVLVHLSYVMSL